MKRIYKYPLSASDAVQRIVMPKGAKILTVQVQGTTPCLWALVDIREADEDRTIIIYGTGHNVVLNGNYIGTYQIGSNLVFHVFEMA